MTQGEQTPAQIVTPAYKAFERLSSEQLLHMQASLIELAHDVILVRDHTSRIIFWNHGAEELYGWTAEAAIGLVTHELLQTRFPVSREAVDTALNEYGRWEGELTHTCADGTRVIVESSQVLMRDELGNPYVILEVNRDITARKEDLARLVRQADLVQQQSQELLKQSARRLQLAQRAGNIGTFEWDIEGDVILWTPELEALYGLPPGSFAGNYEAWRNYIHSDDVAQAEEKLQQAVAGGPPYNTEFRVVWPDGTVHWVLAKGEITSYGEGGKPLQMIGVNVDISRLKEAEQALQSLNAELESRVLERTLSLQQLNKELQRSNQELQDFAYVASHDLQEPLRKIQAFGNLLQEEYGELLGEGKGYVERMCHAATRMRVLIDDLLTFSRVTTHASPFQPVDLNLIAQEVVSDLEARLRSTGGTIEFEQLPTIEADALQIRQLLQNLLSNALKFHQRDVAPVVKVWAEVFTISGDSEVDGEDTSSWCRLFVEDNGIGFEEKYLDRIFTVFQRLHGKGSYEGTGIGLAVVRKIVERHGGTVTAHSRVGQGSTFIVALPVDRTPKEEKKNGE